MKQTQAPIVINLSGEYSVEHSPCCKGSISGDLRLFELDAFLECINEQIDNSKVTKPSKPVTSFLAKLASDFAKSGKSSAELVIAQTLDPSNNTLSYSFKFNLEKP